MSLQAPEELCGLSEPVSPKLVDNELGPEAAALPPKVIQVLLYSTKEQETDV